MQNKKTLGSFGAFTLGLTFLLVSSASAMVPALSYQNPYGDSYVLNINGDANYAVTLYYHNASTSNVYSAMSIGNTSNTGNLQYTLDLSNNNVVNNDYVYVLVNGQSSSPVYLYPNQYNNQYNQYNNNQTQSFDLELDVGETINIPLIPVNGNVTFSHSNQSVASTTQVGSSIDVRGMVAGTDTITVTGTNTSGQTVTGTLVVKVNNVVQNNNQNNQNLWQNRNIFLKNFFQNRYGNNNQGYKPAIKVKNYKKFWDKKVKITYRNYRNNNNNNYNYNNNRNYGRYN